METSKHCLSFMNLNEDNDIWLTAHQLRSFTSMFVLHFNYPVYFKTKIRQNSTIYVYKLESICGVVMTTDC